MSITVDTRKFKRQSARLMDMRQWQGAENFWRQQGSGVMKEVINRMPPSRRRANVAAKKSGENAVEGDIRKVFQAVHPSRAENVDLAAVHRAHRNARGRTRRAKPRRQVKAAVLNAYIREKKKQVGYLAAGFNAAAAKVGYKPPAWIWRHRAPGSMKLRTSTRGIRIKATNRVGYAPRIVRIDAKVQSGINTQANKIRRQVDYLLKRQARKVGFRVR